MAAHPRRSVIIADNNDFYRQVLGDFYRERGLEPRVAADGMEALALIRAAPPDLLVLDLVMPSIDGSQICAWVKSREAYRHIPVIIFSGLRYDEMGDAARIGADAYLAKMPLDQIAEALDQITRSLLEGTPRSGPLRRGFEKMYRREVVLELVQERQAQMSILDSLTEGIVELSSDHRVLRTNRAFDEIAVASASDLLSRPLEEILDEDRSVLRRLFVQLEGGGTAATAVLNHAGRKLQVKLHRLVREIGESSRGETAGPVATSEVRGPERTGYALLVDDITQRVKTENDRKRLRGRLAQSEKMSALNIFVSGAAHQLNNPLTTILGYAELLSSRKAWDAQGVERIAEGARRCKAILEQLMAFSKSLRPAKKTEDINALLLEAVGAYREQMHELGIALDLDLCADPLETLIDPGQIGQVFDHVIRNAVTALGEVGSGRRLAIASRIEMKRIRVEFIDSGPGIPEARLSRIFDPFFTTGADGSVRGMGLSVAYGIVTAHAGRITASNEPSGGAVIRIDLPFETDVSGRTASPVSSLADGIARRILVVDDEAIIAELLVDIFGAYQHEIDSTNSGMEALRMIQDDEYDLIILDLRIPDLSGQQIYGELSRERPELLRRLMFITGDTVMPDVEDFLRSTGSPCLLKPFSVEEIIEQANAILYAPS